MKGRRVMLGRFELTATRIVYYQLSSLWMMFGLIGALLSRRSAGKQALELEFANISSIARGKYGLNKKILDVKLMDGSEHRLVVDKFDEFVERLTAASGRAVAALNP
jgi:hypothetical protein